MRTIFTLVSVAALGLSIASAAGAATITDLDSPIPAGTSWGTLPGENTGTVAITGAAPRSGNGSIELTGNRTRVQTGIQYAGFLTNIGPANGAQSLTFDWQVAADSGRQTYTPALRLLIQNGANRNELVWEGAYNTGVAAGTLASNNPTGQWYSTTASDLFWQNVNGVANETGGSLQLKTIADWAATYSPDATISGLSVGAGSGAGTDYHAFVDNIAFTDGNGTRSYNFELAGAVPEPATWAMMVGGVGIVGGAMRGRRRREGVRAFA